MRTKVLAELKKAYEPFEVFWDEWIKQKGCELDEVEIYVLNVHRQNKFEVEINDFVMFYNKIETVHSIIGKLKRTQSEYREWAVIRFQFRLLHYSCQHNFQIPGISNIEIFFRLPIIILPISDQLKNVLLKFNYSTLGKLFDDHYDCEFENDPWFKLVSEFYTIDNKISDKKSNKNLSICSV